MISVPPALSVAATAPPSIILEAFGLGDVWPITPDAKVQRSPMATAHSPSPTLESSILLGQHHPDFRFSWRSVVGESAFRLRELRAGWDGPCSKPISRKVIYNAECLINEALRGSDLAVAPYLVPSGDGGIQIEWHERNGELELSISPYGEIYFWSRSHASGQEFEAEGERALAFFSRWAPWLAASGNDALDVRVSQSAIDLSPS